MPVIGIAEVLVRPSFKGMQQSIGRELGGLDSKSAKAGRDIGGGVASGLKSSAGLMAGAVAAIGIGAFVAEAAKASDATDKFKATMNFAGIDTSGIDGAAKAAKAYADQTVYDLPTIQNTLAQLASNGVKDYTELTKAAGNLNAVAGGNADTFGSVAMVMTQTAGAGKLTTENWNQLADAIPGAAGPLMKALEGAGAYTGNFRDAMAKGQITSDEFNTALMKLGTKPVAVEAAKSTATFEGAIGNLQATINGGLMTALDAIKPGVTGAVSALSDGLGTVMGEVTGGVEAFGAAWVANDGDITSSGFPGMMEQVAYWGRQAFDYLNGTAIPALQTLGGVLSDSFGPSIERVGNFIRDTLLPNIQGFGGELGGGTLTALQNAGSYLVTDLIPALGNFSTWMLDNWDKIANVATGITVLMLPALVRLGVTALVSAAQQVIAWAMAQGGAIKAGAIYVAQSFMIIGRWVAMGAAALVSGAQTAYVWGLYAIEAVKGAIAHGLQAARVVAGWVLMSGAAVISGIKTAAVWTGSVVAQAATGAVSFLLSAGRVVGGWALMAVQSLFQAGRMALAWFIALGPIGWVIAAVIGLVAIVIANWDSIASFTRDLWEKHVKPVFDALANFITKDVPAAFEQGVGFIKTAWEKLQEIAKVPVRFVIDTIINDGLINGLNNIGGFFNLPKIPRLALPAGFMNGGYTGDGGKDEPAGIVHGGEFVFTKEQTRRAGVRNLYAMAESLAGYADGGFVNPLKSLALTQGYNRIHKGVDFAAGVGTPVFATENGRVSWSGPGVQAPGVWGGNEIHVDGQSGIQEWFAHLSSRAVRVGDMVRAGQQIGLSGNTGITSGPHLHFGTFAGGWPNDVNPLSYLSGAGVPSGGGFNPLAGILDGLLSQFKAAFPAGGFMADLAIGAGKKIFGGVTDFLTGGQGSAAGPALYDLGGVLPPGVSQVVNRTGKPEAILNPQQWADISRLATQGGGGFEGNLYLDSGEFLGKVRGAARQEIASADAGSQYARPGRR